MKIDGLDIKKWWHWLVAIAVLALLVLLAFILAQGIICWACKPVNNITTSGHVIIESSPPNQQNHPAQIYPVNNDNSTISPPSPTPILPLDNCSWGH